MHMFEHKVIQTFEISIFKFRLLIISSFSSKMLLFLLFYHFTTVGLETDKPIEITVLHSHYCEMIKTRLSFEQQDSKNCSFNTTSYFGHTQGLIDYL